MNNVAATGRDELCVNTIRFLAVDAIQKANSGHPGMPMGAAPMAYVLWDRFLRHNPANPDWFDRDRFVLSAGHGSMLLYALLHLTGYDLSLDDIKQFRQWGSKTPGHPERGHTPGVETTTGPLGQGLGNAVGMAMSEAHLAARFNRHGFEVINHHTYCIAGDGDLMEGVAAEAASLAGHLKLGKLICLYDDNGISLAASTGLSFSEDCGQRFAAYGWQVLRVEDGNDLEAIQTAITTAREEAARPSLLMVRTHIGFGSPNRQDTFEAHGAPLGEREVKLAKNALGWPEQPLFHVPEEVKAFFRRAVINGAMAEQQWFTVMEQFARTEPGLAGELGRIMAGALPAGWQTQIPVFAADPKGISTRAASGQILNAVAPEITQLLGGSADLNPSTFTSLAGMGDFQSTARDIADRQGQCGGGWGYEGRNIHFGVREHGMGAVLNGMAAHGGCIPFGATFLIFSDYLRPSMRLAALMKLHIIYIFTHDSIAVGEDGPTHQPVEQLASLRAIPNLTVIRPGDANETAEAWRVALELKSGPVALVLSRQNLPVLDRKFQASAEGLSRGGYLLSGASSQRPDLILIASGSEVALIIAARNLLEQEGLVVNLVSMPSWELFDAQPETYRNQVLPPAVTARLAVEAGSTLGWHRLVGDRGKVIGVEHFGASAPGPLVMEKLGFTLEHICNVARAVVES
jgi:transketolase